MPNWIGLTLSKVELQHRLGRGGMAEVYRGHHTTLNRPVAVKILHSFLSEDESALRRFRAEAQSVAALRHPHIVQVFDFDLVDGQPYIVMELVEGVTLESYLDHTQATQRRVPPETTARLITALCSALEYAHLRGIVHRDVKPANVILRRDSGPLDLDAPLPLDAEPVLADFGVARLASVVSLSGSISGTPAYFSPEQAKGETVDSRSDVYSLGVMLYEMLAGQLPFQVEDGNLVAMLFKHLNEQPPPIEGLNAATQIVVDKVLAKPREARYQTAGEFASELLIAVLGATRSLTPPFSDLPQLATLIDSLDLLAQQAKTYERALPANNYPARAAVTALSKLAAQALNEARDLAGTLKPATLPSTKHPFSPREYEVLTLAAQGLTNKEIAYRLGLSERTVQFHINSIFNKTTTNSRTEAVAVALRNGWLGTK